MILLVIVLLISIGIVFNPIIPVIDLGSDQQVVDEEDQTWYEENIDLQYGIELAGGTRIQAPLIGSTAEGVSYESYDSANDAESAIAEELDVSSTRIIIRDPVDDDDPVHGKSTIEMTDEDKTKDDFETALNNIDDIHYEEVRTGLKEETRDETVDILQEKLDQSGFAGSSVRVTNSIDGVYNLLIEIPDADREEAINIISERGEVTIDIYYPQDQETLSDYKTEEAVLERNDFTSIGSASRGEGDQQPHVPVNLEDDAANRFAESTIETGVASEGGSNCLYDNDPDNTEACLLTLVDGEVIYSAGMAPSLADSIRSGTWQEQPNFILQTEDYDEARELSVHLREGSLPASLDISLEGESEGEISFVSATQGDTFRSAAIATGALAALTVSLLVAARYKRPKIVFPLLLTAFSEIFILLAIASLMRYPIDLSVIAGFVAVIGTGVDDLIIITDKILGSGKNPASSERIFTKRFRKALWIIIGAAITTILALLPLATLNLQQLQGFAIFTIIGVIIGVFVTRPAYGDMLRYLYTDKYE